MKALKIRHLVIALVIIMSLVLSSSCSLVSTEPPSSSDPTVAPPVAIDTSATLTIADVVALVRPSVVAINTEYVGYDAFNRPYTQQGAGSGWIIDEDGIIVTNNHVVEGAQSVIVTLADGRTFSAVTISTDSLSDLAVIRVNAVDLPAVKVGDSDALRVGDWVVAIGNSLGLGISATKGIVSAQDISLSVAAGQTLDDLIQTDAAINPGNSGGPLVNLAGEVVGINSIKISQVGIEGMGYAISIDEAAPLIQQLIASGYVNRPWLGISIYPVTAQVAQSYDLGIDHGILITEVVAGSPADAAGLEMGDVITAIEGQEISDARALLQAITSHQIGQEAEITYYRGETEATTTVTLAESPPPDFS